MNKNLKIVAGSFALFISGYLSAENTAQFKPYVSLEGNFNKVSKADNVSYKNCLGGGVTFGFNYESFDVGIAIGYLQTKTKEFTEDSRNGYEFTDENKDWLSKQKYSILSGMLNARYNYSFTDDIYAYGIVGVGIASTRLDFVQKGEDQFGGIIYITDKASMSNVNFAYNLGLGLGYKLTQNLSLECGYTFFAVCGKSKVVWNSERNELTVKAPKIHKIGVAIRYNF